MSSLRRREIKQRADSRANAVADWISEQVLASQYLDDATGKEVINQISTVSRGAHLLSVVTLAIALFALVGAIATFITVILMLRLLWSVVAAIIFRGPLRCTYIDRT